MHLSQRTKHGVNAAADTALQDEFLGVDVAALHVVRPRNRPCAGPMQSVVSVEGVMERASSGLMREDDALDVFGLTSYIGHADDFHGLRDAYGGTIPRGLNLIDVVHADELR